MVLRLTTTTCLLIGIVALSSVALFYYSAKQSSADEFEEVRANMVETQLMARGISDPTVLEVMGRVPRHLFVKSV